MHRGKECICIRFPHDPALQTTIRSLRNARWSQTHKCWYLPLSSDYLNVLTAACGGNVTVDVTAVSEYLKQKVRSPRLVQSLLTDHPDTGMYAEISQENFQSKQNAKELPSQRSHRQNRQIKSKKEVADNKVMTAEQLCLNICTKLNRRNPIQRLY